jgi:hypothetical protein
MWDVRSGLEVANFAVEELPTSLAFSPEGKILAVGFHYAKKVGLWNVADILAKGATRLP